MNLSTVSHLQGTGFCNDSLWTSIELEPNSQIPVFTWCFQHTILAGLPPLLFLVTLPILWVQLSYDRNEVLPWSTLMSFKQLLTTLLFVDKFFLFLYSLYQIIFTDIPVPLVEIVYPFIHAITLVGIFLASDECRKKGITSSGVIFIVWLLFVITSIPEFYAWFKLGSNPKTVGIINDNVRYITFLVWFPLVFLQLFLHCFANKSSRNIGKKDSPESEVSFLNQQFFWWFNDICKIGHKKALEVKDLYNIEEDMSAQFLHKRWEKVWSPVMQKYHKKLQNAQEVVKHEIVDRNEDSSVIVTADDTAPLIKTRKKSSHYGATINHEVKDKSTVKSPAPPSIIWRLFILFKWQFIGGTLVKLISDILQFANPLLLNELITFTENPNSPLWFGFVLAISMFVVSELRSIFFNNHFYLMFRAGINIQNVLTVAVYEKALKLSNSARRDKTIGEIVNLMSIDVERFQQITNQIQQYWSGPFQIILALFMLYQTIGLAFIGGVIVMILLIPLNFVVSIRFKKWQAEQMKLKDERLNMSNEILNGIKVIKLYAWELPMLQVIADIRKRELSVLRKAMLLRYITDMINVSSPFMVSLVAFAAYVLAGNPLTPQIAFVSLTLFSYLRPPMMTMADLIGQTVQCIVSNRRLKNFFVAEELDPSAVARDQNPEYPRAIDIEAGTFKWERLARPTLRNITFHIPRGILVAVVGQVGSGKSSLLSALLGEMEKVQGYVGLRGKVAYVPQQSWIQNMTVRDNIIFQKQFDQELYDKVIDACALKRDLEILPHGDMTEIGEKGINLSGGQKARISLARSLYQSCDVYLFDDPLSAVDAIVGRHIFDKVLGPQGMLKDATRILSTHSITYLKEADLAVVMKDGAITHMGEFDDLLNDPEAAQYLTSIELESSESAYSTDKDETEIEDEVKSLAGSSIVTPASVVTSHRSTKEPAPIGARRRSTKASTVRSVKTATSKISEKITKIPIKMIKEEFVETGKVKFSVYFQYFKAMNWILFLAFIIITITSSAAAVLRSFWLSAWSDDSTKNITQQMPMGERLGIFAVLGISETLFLGLSNAFLVFGSVTASSNLHRPLVYNLLRLPLAFFDVTPLGRILNRLGKDIETVDLLLPGSFRMLVLAFLMVLQVLIVISISTPIFIIVALVMFVFYIWILRYFITTARQLQRLTSINRSPLFAYFSESVQGASSIRAYDAVPVFFNNFCRMVDTFINVKYASVIATRWLAVRLEFIGNGVILAAAVLAVLSKASGSMTAGVIGLSVSYSFNITYMLNMLIRQLSDVETNIVAVERIKEYSEVQNEANWKSTTPEQQTPPPKWPTEGVISFINYSTRYRPELDLSLRDLNIEIRANEKVGIAGRTGAGKSSVALALFRIIEPAGGKIIIDGIDVSKIGLHELRSRITIIPQDPVLFSGTLRFNLDPFNEYADGDLWSALDYAHLKNFFQSQPNGLYHIIAEGGENISIGQRQLVCLARAILRRSRVLVLDEATASIDVVTDSLIQRTIRDQFIDSTVITIAHRIHTIMDYDRILVLDHGKVVEFDTPKNLLANKKSLFYSMVNSQD